MRLLDLVNLTVGQFVEERLRMAAVERELNAYVDTLRGNDGSGSPDEDTEDEDDVSVK